MQKIQNGTLASLLPKNSETWLDGAHNTAGAEMIAATLTTFSQMPTFLINGMTRDRDIEGFLLPFKTAVEYLFAVPVEWEPKSENPKKTSIKNPFFRHEKFFEKVSLSISCGFVFRWDSIS